MKYDGKEMAVGLRIVMLSVFVIIITASFFFSCGESAKERAQRERIDSLENANFQVKMDFDDLQQYLSIIADGLDSISIEENEIFFNHTPGENLQMNRQRMKQKLGHVREILARHRERINELEKQLSEKHGDTKKLRTIIIALRQQLEQKDAELMQLRTDLEDSRKNITDLKAQVTRMQSVQENQEQTIQEQKETIKGQSDKIYTAYVRIASKKELKNEGILSSGFLQKKKVDYSQIDLSTFRCIDTRTISSFNLPRKYKILTPIPETSYDIEKDFDGNILHILNREHFWSISNYLIIQTD